jgi:hypothetical protein
MRGWRILAAVLPLLAMAAESRQYVIELNGDPARTSAEQILKEQRAVRKQLEKLGVEVLDHTVRTSNTLLVRMSGDLVPRVEAIAGVKRVRPSREFRRR